MGTIVSGNRHAIGVSILGVDMGCWLDEGIMTQRGKTDADRGGDPDESIADVSAGIVVTCRSDTSGVSIRGAVTARCCNTGIVTMKMEINPNLERRADEWIADAPIAVVAEYKSIIVGMGIQ